MLILNPYIIAFHAVVGSHCSEGWFFILIGLIISTVAKLVTLELHSYLTPPPKICINIFFSKGAILIVQVF